jgi:hypothetical protein
VIVPFVLLTLVWGFLQSHFLSNITFGIGFDFGGLFCCVFLISLVSTPYFFLSSYLISGSLSIFLKLVLSSLTFFLLFFISYSMHF